MSPVRSDPPLRGAAGPDRASRNVEDQLVIAAFAQLRPLALGVSFGFVAGVLVAIATAIVLIEASGAASTDSVGYHLGLLRNYFPGYRVTWFGAAIGFAYAVVYGFVFGALLAAFLNFVHRLYIRLVHRRMRRGVMVNDL
jgi:hypothetical protein